LLLRTFAGSRVWRPHREHFYQRLVLLGWSQQKLLVAEGIVMIACSLMAIAALEAPVPFRWLP
jgi:hypothetical protein